jgi:oxidase EvaA
MKDIDTEQAGTWTAGLADTFDIDALHAATQRHAATRRDGAATLDELIQWLDDQKSSNHILQHRVGLKELEDWTMDPRGFFSHRAHRYFTVVGIRVTSPYREVSTWDQPILVNAGTGIIGLLIRKRAGAIEVLLQAKAEVGNRHIVQIAPTVQFTPGNYEDNMLLKKPFLYGEFFSPRRYPVLHESRQSEEGGRFYKEDHLHRILLLPEDAVLELPLSYRWLTLEQVRFFLHLGEAVNSCARSILACFI